MQASALLLLPCQSFPPQFLSFSSPADCPRRLCSPGRPRLPISDARKLPGPPVAADAFASSSFACCVIGTSSGAGVGSSFGFPDEEDSEKWDSAKYEALLKGGDQVTSVLQEMVKLLADMELDQASEAAAVAIAAQGVIGKRVDEMEAGFMMALDYMIQLAEKDKDDEV